jgi:hypothetical protein
MTERRDAHGGVDRIEVGNVTDSEAVAIGPGATAIKNVYQQVEARPADPAEVAAAARLLQTLPRDRVPAPALLPRGARMALRPNPLFVGRHADLQWLAVALKESQVAAVTGWGGVGKTQVAVEFVHRYGQFFGGGVFWLSFATAAGVSAEVATCGGPGHLGLRLDCGGLALEDQGRLVLAAWQDGRPRLLVFDNCEAPDLLAQWRPLSGPCRVLVTSRRAAWPRVLAVRPVPLDVLSREASVALLRQDRDDLSGAASDRDAIADELGNLPLALHFAGSVLARYRDALTPAEYLVQLRQPGLFASQWLPSSEVSPTGAWSRQHTGALAGWCRRTRQCSNRPPSTSGIASPGSSLVTPCGGPSASC